MPLNPEHDKFLRSTVQEMLDNDLSEQDIYKVRNAWIQKWGYDETAGGYKTTPTPQPTSQPQQDDGILRNVSETAGKVLRGIIGGATGAANLANRAVEGPIGTVGRSIKEAVTVPLTGAASFFPSGILGGQETELGRNISEVMTDQPTTKAGELSGRILGFPFELLHKGAQKAGDVVERSILEDPILSGTAPLRTKPLFSVPKSAIPTIAGIAGATTATGLEFGGMLALGKVGKLAEAKLAKLTGKLKVAKEAVEAAKANPTPEAIDYANLTNGELRAVLDDIIANETNPQKIAALQRVRVVNHLNDKVVAELKRSQMESEALRRAQEEVIQKKGVAETVEAAVAKGTVSKLFARAKEGITRDAFKSLSSDVKEAFLRDPEYSAKLDEIVRPNADAIISNPDAYYDALRKASSLADEFAFDKKLVGERRATSRTGTEPPPLEQRAAPRTEPGGVTLSPELQKTYPDGVLPKDKNFAAWTSPQGQIYVGQTHGQPGFIPGVIEKGTWTEGFYNQDAGFFKRGETPPIPTKPTPPTSPVAPPATKAPPAVEEVKGGLPGGEGASVGAYAIPKQALLRQPEIVRLARELLGGEYPSVKEKLRAARGMAGGLFRGKPTGEMKIDLRADIFKEPGQAEATLAHEIGHAVDFLPDNVKARGNIFGRIASLKKYLKSFLEETPESPESILTPETRQSYRSYVIHQELAARGKSFKDYMFNPELRAEMKDVVAAKYREAIEGVVGHERLWTKPEIMAELKALSKEWRPYQEETALPSFLKYRHSPSELYADALSVLLNDPEMLQAKAPKFSQAFFNYLERKPEFKKTYEGIQEELRSGQADEVLLDETNKMFQKGDEALGKLVGEPTDKYGLKGLGVKLAKTFGLRHAALTKLEKKVPGLSPKERPSYAIENMIYQGAERNEYMQQVRDGMITPLKEGGVDYNTFRTWTFLNRVLHERSGIANPLGWTSELAAGELARMEKVMGPEYMGKMRNAWENFNKTRQEMVISKMEKSGAYPKDLIDQMKNADHYATFDVQKYAEERYGRGIGARIYHQIGTLSEINDPIAATVMKDISIMGSVNRSMAMESVVKFIQKNMPDLISSAETRFNGRIRIPEEPRDPNMGMLAYLKDGKAEGYYLPKELTEAFERNPIEATWMAKTSKTLANPFRAAFTGYNPGFWAFNVIRDYMGTVKQTPGLSFLLPGIKKTPLWVYYLKSLKPTYRLVGSQPDAVISEMRKGNMTISVAEMGNKFTDVDLQIERELARYGLREETMSPFRNLVEKYASVGSFTEQLTKVSGFQALKEKFPGMAPEERAHMVRTRVGSPPFLIKGEFTPITNNVALYSNAMVQGVRASVESMRANPAHYWWATAKSALAPTAITLAGTIGLLGPKYKEMLDNVSEYDKSNYTVIPLGMTPSGKTVLLRIPRDEMGRFFGGVFWKSANYALGRGTTSQQVFDYTAGQFPSASPYVSVAMDAIQYASGKNPYDWFRGKYAIPERTFEAGGKESVEAFAKHEANELGAGLIYRFKTEDVEEIKSDLEKALEMPVVGNIIGRFIKVTDQGKGEQVELVSGKARKEETRRQLDVRGSIIQDIQKREAPADTGAINNLFRGLKEKGKLSPTYSLPIFSKMYKRYEVKRGGDPEFEAFVYAATTNEKTAMLDYFKGKKSPDEFKSFVAELFDDGLISAALKEKYVPTELPFRGQGRISMTRLPFRAKAVNE